jgi:hypothetical protein
MASEPAVALVGLVSGVISIIQAVIAVGKWVSGKASKENGRRRYFVYFSTVCATVSAIMVPVTWTAIVAADLGTGDPRWISLLYPVIPLLMVLTGCIGLHAFDSPEKKLPSLLALGQIALGLVSPPLAYSFYNGALFWERGLLGALPAFAFVMAIPLILTYAMKSGTKKAVDVRSGSASTTATKCDLARSGFVIWGA